MAGRFKSIFKSSPETVPAPKKEKPLMRALEPRILLDAAVMETYVDFAGRAAHNQLADDYLAEQNPGEDEPRMSVESVPPMDTAGVIEPVAGEAFVTEADVDEASGSDVSAREIVFIDAGVSDPDGLVASLQPGVRVVMIEADEDGVLQIAKALETGGPYDAVHIFSHGTAGALQLGDGTLNETTITGQYRAALASIGRNLSDEGDILIYGCDFGQGEEGRRAAGLLAGLTAADIAASDDLTGSESLAGDWDLEVQLGHVQSRAFSAPDWDGILAAYVIEAQGGPVIGHIDGGIVGTEGTTALWANAVSQDDGMGGTTFFDIRATLVGQTEFAATTFETTNIHGPTADDFRVVLTNTGPQDPNGVVPGALEPAQATVRWEILVAGTNTPAPPDQINILLDDIAGKGGVALSDQVVSVQAQEISRYTVENNNDLEIDGNEEGIFAAGTTEITDERDQIAIEWESANSFVVTYLSTSLINNFDMAGTDDLTSFTNPNTVEARSIDLNGVSDPGNDYTTTYVNVSTVAEDPGMPETFDVPVSITDLDVEIFDLDNTEIQGATITLTNAFAGDRLNFDTTLLNTLKLDVTSFTIPGGGVGPDQIVVELQNPARISNYLTAIQSITYANGLADGAFNTSPRIIDVTITDGVGDASATTTVLIGSAGLGPITGNNVYVADEGGTISATDVTGILGDDRDGNGDDLDVVSVTDAMGVALVPEMVMGVPTGYLVNPTDPISGNSTLTNGATLRVNMEDGSFTYTPTPFYNGSETFAYQASDGTFSTDGFFTFDIQPVANDVSLTIIGPDPLTDPGTDEDRPTQTISVNASSPDANEDIFYLAADIPVGVVLTDGLNLFRASDDEREVDITDWNRNVLRVLPIENSDNEIDITFIATSVEVDGSFTEELDVATYKINAVADLPTLIVNDAKAGIDEDVDLSSIIQPQLFDTDGSEQFTDITISDIPVGAQILVDGTSRAIVGGAVSLSPVDLPFLVFRPPQTGAIVTYVMQVSATATEVNPNGDVSVLSSTQSGIRLEVTLDDVSEPVIAVDDTASTFSGQPVTINVLGNDTINDGTPIITRVNGIGIDVPTPVTLPGGEGVVRMDGLGALIFEPTANFSGDVTFSYTVQDVDLDEGTANVTVSVLPRWLITSNGTVDEDTGNAQAVFTIELDGAIDQGDIITADLTLVDGNTDAADRQDLAGAIAASLAGPPVQEDFSFNGTTLAYSAPDTNYTVEYDPTGSTFTNIQSTGIPVPLGDDGLTQQLLGFNFKFYGDTYDRIFISANGYMTFANTTAATDGETLDGTALGGRTALAPYWDDLDTTAGSVYVETRFNAQGQQEFIVQWHDVTNKQGGVERGTFQAILTAETGEIRYNYVDVDFANAGSDGGTATIGLQSASGVADEHAHNMPASVVSGSSLVFTRGAINNPTLTINVDINDDPNFEVAENFALEFSNPSGAALGNTRATVVIDVSDNMAPVAADDVATVTETGTVVVQVIDPNPGTTGEAGEDSDPEGHDLEIATVEGNLINGTTIIGLPGGSNVTVEPDGTFTYDPNGKFASLAVGQTATETITYFVRDEYGELSATPATLTITINGENQTAQADLDAGTLAVDTTALIEYPPTANAQAILANPAALLDPDDSAFTGIRLDLGGFVQNGTEFIAVGSASFLINTAPGFPSTQNATIGGVALEISYNGFDRISMVRDPGGEFTAAEAAAILAAITYENTSTDDTPGIRTIDIRVDDGQAVGDPSTISVQVLGNNVAPTAVDDGDVTPFPVVEDTPTDFLVADLLANDFDNDIGDSISFVSAQDGPNGTVSYDPISETITFTPNANFTGATSFTYTIQDQQLTTATATVFVDVTPVNDAPDVDLNGVDGGTDYAFTFDENDPLTPIVAGDATVFDIDSANLTGLDIVMTGGQTGDILWPLTLPGSLTLTAIPPNVETGLLSPTTVTLELRGNASPSTYEIALKMIRFGNPLEKLDETPRVVEVTATDGALTSTVATTTITVNDINDDPVANSDNGFTLDEDTFIVIPQADLLSNDTDIEGDTLSVVSVDNAPIGASVGFNGGGDIVFVPAANQFGPMSFTYTVDDGNGGQQVGLVELTVASINDATVIDLDTNTLLDGYTGDYTEDSVPAPLVDATFTITDVDDNFMESATIVLTNGFAGDFINASSVVAPISASFSSPVPLTADGPLTLTLSGTATRAQYADAIRSLSFSVVTDAPVETDRLFDIALNDGDDTSNVARALITVTAVNDAPVADDDTLVDGDEDVSRTIDRADLLTNDLDPDIEQVTIVAALLDNPAHGTLVLNGDESITFTPTADFFGTVTFTYTIEDAAGLQDTAVASFNVTSVNDVPVIDLDNDPLNGTGFAVGYNEDDAVGVAIVDPTIVLADVDDVQFTSARIVISDAQVGDSLVVTGLPGTITANFTPPTLPLTAAQPLTVELIGSASLADYEAALQGLRFLSDSNAPTLVSPTRTIDITVNDGEGDSNLVTTTVTITPSNDAPVGAADAFTMDEDTTLPLTEAALLFNDVDPDGDTLDITAVGGEVNGTASLVGNQIFFQADPDFAGIASFDYTVEDPSGTTDTVTVTLTVNPVNDAPVVDLAGSDPLTDGYTDRYVERDAPLAVADADVVFNDIDNANLAGLTVTITNGQVGDLLIVGALPPGINVASAPAGPALVPGVVELRLTGAATLADYQTALQAIGYSSASNDPSTVNRSIAITVTDGALNSAPVTTVMEVESVNDAPVPGVDGVFTFDEDTNFTISDTALLLNDTDGENNPLTITGVGAASNGTVTLLGGQITFVPNANYNGPASFEYTVTDGFDPVQGTVNLFIAAVDDPPAFTNGNGYVVRYTEDGASVPVVDGATALDDVDNLQLQGASIVLTNGQVGDLLTVAALPGGITASILPAGPLPVAQSVTVTLSGAADIADYEAALQLVSFETVSNAPSETDRAFAITVNDGNTNSAPLNTVVEVRGVNDAPTVVDDGPFTLDEDTPFQAAAVNFLFNDSDFEGDALTVVGVGGAVNGAVVLSSGGIITFTPNADYFGPASFAYDVRDALGAVSTGTVDLNYTSVNDVVELRLDGNPGSDQRLTAYTENDVGRVLVEAAATLVDVDNPNPAGATVALFDGKAGDTLEAAAYAGPLTITTVPPSGTLGADGLLQLTITGAGTQADYLAALQAVTYSSTSENPDTSTRSLQIYITDGIDTSAPAEVLVAITAVNDAPVAADDGVFTFDEDTVLELPAASLTANDTDAENDALTIIAVNGPANGTVSLDPDNVIRFTPTAAYSGPASFEYTVRDPAGLTHTATVNLFVTAVNDAPILDLNGLATPATGFAATYVENGPGLAIVDPAVSIFDEDHGALQSAQVVLTNGQPGDVLELGAIPGTISPNISPSSALTSTGTVTITLTGNAALADYEAALAAITYRSISENPDVTSRVIEVTGFDGQDTSVAAVSTITITAVNDAPDAQDDGRPVPITVLEDTPFTFNPVASNDTDFEGDVLTITDINGAPIAIGGSVLFPEGTVALAADGQTLTFTPVPNAFGPVSFDYTITDGDLTDTAIVDLNVLPVNDAPDAVDDGPVVLVEDGFTSFDPITPNDSDVEGDPLSISEIMGQPIAIGGSVTTVYGDVSLGLDGRTLTFTPLPDFAGQALITYGVTDGADVGTATITFDVTPVDDPLVITGTPGTVALDDGQVVNLNMAAFVTDVDGDALTFAATGLPTGLFIDTSTGIISGQLAADASQTSPYGVVITVGDGVSSTESFGFTLEASNTVPLPSGGQTVVLPEGDDFTITVAGYFTDADGDALTFEATNVPAWVSFDGEKLTGTVPSDASVFGTVIIQLSADDGEGGTADAALTLDPRNVSPVQLGMIADKVVQEGDAVSIQLAGLFEDGGNDSDALVGSVLGLPDGLSFDPVSGEIGGIATTPSLTPYVIGIVITDEQGAAVSTTFSITVNAKPVVEEPVATTPPVVNTPPVDPGPQIFSDFVPDQGVAEEASGQSALFEDLVNFEPDQSEISTIDPLSIISMIDQIAGLNGTAAADKEGAVNETVNGVQSLNGAVPPASGGTGGETVTFGFQSATWVGNKTAGESGAAGTSTLTSSFLEPVSLLPSSEREKEEDKEIELGQKGDTRLARFSLTATERAGKLYLQLTNALHATRDGKLASAEVTTTDGKPLPEWMRVIRSDFVTAEPPVGLEKFALRLSIELESGEKLSKLVMVDVATGQVTGATVKEALKVDGDVREMTRSDASAAAPSNGDLPKGDPAQAG
ncbi:MAG: tandem-95 repeat protein [Pseudomonadota bacterium]